MSKAKQAWLGIGVIAAAVVVLLLMLPKKDICTDTIRGFTESANSSVGVILSGYTSLKGALGTESTYKAPEIEKLVQCATLFCTYPAVAASAAFARVTLARMSLARAVQMNGLGSML